MWSEALRLISGITRSSSIKYALIRGNERKFSNIVKCVAKTEAGAIQAEGNGALFYSLNGISPTGRLFIYTASE